MIDIEKLRAKPKEFEFMGSMIKIFPLKTRHLAELGELQAKEKFADATMLLIRETFNRMLEEEEIAKKLKEGKSRLEARESAKQITYLTDDDINEFNQEELDKLMKPILEVNGLKIPENKKKQIS